MNPPASAQQLRADRLVLVADDETDMREAMAMLLAMHGYRVLQARNGLEAAAMALTHRPAFALIDIGMPVMDGYRAASQMRRDTALDATTLIAVSGYATDRHRRQAHEAGMDVYLTKPVDSALLLSILDGASQRLRTVTA